MAGAALIAVDALIQQFVKVVAIEGLAAESAVPEYYPLLRTIQLAVEGYSRHRCWGDRFSGR
jgi:hypothetical protein